MKKLLLIMGGVFALLVALSLVGPMIGLLFSGLLVFIGIHYYLKSDSVFWKVMWVIVGLFGLLSAISNIPAILGLVAIAVFYMIYKKWKDEDASTFGFKSEDPFTNFEKEWKNLTQ